MKRVETGPIRFGDDWPGVFIRGDNAFGWAIHLRELRETYGLGTALDGLIETLESCDQRRIALGAITQLQPPVAATTEDTEKEGE